MQQLGPKFIENILLPYIKDTILENENIKKDKRLQNLFRYDAVIKPNEIDGLKNDYFKRTNTFLDTDLKARDLFWDEFIEFVKAEKNGCSGDINLLATRLLPDFETGKFSESAENNLSRLAHHYVKAEEKRLIEDLIKKREASGEITSDEAKDLRDKNENNQLVLARTKDQKGAFDIIESEEIRRALDNVEKQSALINDLFTETGPKGQRGFLMNPPFSEPVAEENREHSSSLIGFQEAVWEGQKVDIEKKLANNGFILQRSFQVDKNGSVKGEALDQKSRTKLIIRANLADPYQEGQRNFRIIFADNPQKSFLIKESELWNFQDRPVTDIYLQKQSEEAKKTDMPPTGKPIIAGPKEGVDRQPSIATGAGAKIGLETEHKASQPILPERMGDLAMQPVPVLAAKGKEASLKAETEKQESRYARTTTRPSVMEAKQRYAERKRKEEGPETQLEQTPSMGLRASLKKPGVKVGLVYGLCAGGGLAGLFWSAIT